MPPARRASTRERATTTALIPSRNHSGGKRFTLAIYRGCAARAEQRVAACGIGWLVCLANCFDDAIGWQKALEIGLKAVARAQGVEERMQFAGVAAALVTGVERSRLPGAAPPFAGPRCARAVLRFVDRHFPKIVEFHHG